MEFEYHKVSLSRIDRLGSKFIKLHGDNNEGRIAEDDFDRLFDHLVEILRKYGTFAEGCGDADFIGSRYVDQMPWITIVPNENISPSVALAAGLEAVQSSHRPVIIGFDFYPNGLLISPPNHVYSTFSQKALAPLS